MVICGHDDVAEHLRAFLLHGSILYSPHGDKHVCLIKNREGDMRYKSKVAATFTRQHITRRL